VRGLASDARIASERLRRAVLVVAERLGEPMRSAFVELHAAVEQLGKALIDLANELPGDGRAPVKRPRLELRREPVLQGQPRQPRRGRPMVRLGNAKASPHRVRE